MSLVNFELFVELFKWMSDFLASSLLFFFSYSPVVCSLNAIYMNIRQLTASLKVQIYFSALLLERKIKICVLLNAMAEKSWKLAALFSHVVIDEGTRTMPIRSVWLFLPVSWIFLSAFRTTWQSQWTVCGFGYLWKCCLSVCLYRNDTDKLFSLILLEMGSGEGNFPLMFLVSQHFCRVPGKCSSCRARVDKIEQVRYSEIKLKRCWTVLGDSVKCRGKTKSFAQPCAFGNIWSVLLGSETNLLASELLFIFTSLHTISFICSINYHIYGPMCSYPKGI